jgi:hypothetical protein
LPPLQLSLVQALPSLQSLDVAQLPPQPMIGLKTQAPPAGSQLSLVQLSLSLHTLALPGLQLPSLQLSLRVHLLPSSQAALLAVYLQPFVASQPSVVHRLSSLHTGAAPPAQTPPLHTSPVVQALPSLQDCVLLRNLQPLAGSQLSVVQGLLSLQLTAEGPAQVPPAQASPLVHALLSLQLTVLLV